MLYISGILSVFIISELVQTHLKFFVYFLSLLSLNFTTKDQSFSMLIKNVTLHIYGFESL